MDQYLSLQEYHRELIEECILQDDAGMLIDHSEVKQLVRDRFKQRS